MRLTSLAILLCLVAPLASAEDATQLKAREVLELMGAEKLFNESIDQLVDTQIQQSPELTPLRPTLEAFFYQYMGWASLADAAAAETAEKFNMEELDAIGAFYATAAGQKSLELPRILGRTAEVGAKRVTANKGELEMILNERVRELRREAEQ